MPHALTCEALLKPPPNAPYYIAMSNGSWVKHKLIALDPAFSYKCTMYAPLQWQMSSKNLSSFNDKAPTT